MTPASPLGLLAQVAPAAETASTVEIPAGARLVAGLVLACAGLALAPAVVALARRQFPGRNVVFVRWGFSHVAGAALAAVAALVLVPAFLPVDAPADGEGAALADLVGLLGRMVLVLGAPAAAAVWIARRVEPEGVRGLGLWRGKHLRAVGTGLACYLLLLPGLAGVFLAWPPLYEALGGTPELQPHLVAFADLSGAGLALAVVLAVAVLPLLEELCFRAFLQPLLVQNTNEPAGVALTSLVFAALHGGSAFLPIFAFSLVLGAVMVRTQRLAAVWAVHALHNGGTLALFLLLPENVRA